MTRSVSAGGVAAPGASDVRGAPRVLALEGVSKIKDAVEVITRVLRLADEQPHVDQCKNDIADIACAAHTPVLKHESRCHAKPLEREFTTRMCEFRPRNVATFSKARLTVFECSEQEQIRALVKALLTQTYLIHDTITECQLSHYGKPRNWEIEQLFTTTWATTDAWSALTATPPSSDGK